MTRIAPWAAFAALACLGFGEHPARADWAYAYGALVCEGNRALLRFTMAHDEEEPGFVGLAADLPVAGIRDLDALAPTTPEACMLEDGRAVVLRQGDMQDTRSYGACGMESRETFSLWLDGSEVYRQSVWRERCDDRPIRAILLDRDRLTECRGPMPGDGAASDVPQVACVDRSDLLRPRPANPDRPGEIRLLRAAYGAEHFCRGLISLEPQLPGGSHRWRTWPTFQRDGIETLLGPDPGPDARPRLLDLDNSGRLSRAVSSRPENGGGPGADKTVWSPMPFDATEAEVEERAAALDIAWGEEEITRLRGSGVSVFGGDQTAFRSFYGVHLRPFRREGVTWMLAEVRGFPEDREAPTGIVLRPFPDGGMEEVCAFRATPPL